MPHLSKTRSRAFSFIVIGAAATSLICVSDLAIRAAEPPSEATPETELKSEPLSPAARKIREALEGKSTGETGDGVLDDVLGIIKQRRSILNGSSLDPGNSNLPAAGKPHSVSDTARAAEQLLKAARLLETIGSPDADRWELVKRMRAEAASLLTE